MLQEYTEQLYLPAAREEAAEFSPRPRRKVPVEGLLASR